MHATVLPLHPSQRHPLTGEPIRAIWKRPDGRLVWPIMGGSQAPPEPTPPPPTPPTPPAPPAPPAPANGNATDADGKDLGYPKDTPVAEMTDAQGKAYYKHQAQKHEGRYKNLTGDRSFDDTKHALEEYERFQKEQQTPAEQALTAARDEGKKAGLTEARIESAGTIFRGALEAGGITGDDLEELVSNFNVANYIGDNGVETAKIAAFAKRFTTSDKGTSQRRDFGAGRRQEGQPARGAAGKAEAERRFGTK